MTKGWVAKRESARISGITKISDWRMVWLQNARSRRISVNVVPTLDLINWRSAPIKLTSAIGVSAQIGCQFCQVIQCLIGPCLQTLKLIHCFESCQFAGAGHRCAGEHGIK